MARGGSGLVKRAVLLLVMASCRYHATNAENLGAECETHCSTTHLRCVQNGMAAKLGLPGITYDLCRRDLESCQRDCRPMQPPVTLADTPNEAPRDGVIWEPELKRLSCTRSSLRVTLTDDGAQSVTHAGSDAAMINLAPDAVLLVRGGDKALPSLIDDWAMLHGQLTGANDAKLDGQLNAKISDGETVWTASYESSGTRFIVRARELSKCRWLTVEREGATRRIAPLSSW
jgi:hypothetical protein